MEHTRLSSFALSKGCSISEVVRHSVEKYLNEAGQEETKKHESILAKRLHKLENRLADLTVLATRAAAQTLYYTTLPYARGGLPPAPLKPEAYEAQWQKSRSFASQFLQNASVDPLPIAQNEDKSK